MSIRIKSFLAVILLVLLPAVCLAAKPQKQLQAGKINALKVGETVTVSGTFHPSVGLDLVLEYDETAFTVKREVKMDRPGDNRPGSDSGTVTYQITPKKSGMFTLTTYVDYRGEKEDVKKYLVSVKATRGKRK